MVSVKLLIHVYSKANNKKDDDGGLGQNGLASRKRMHLEYKITSENDAATKGRNQETFITVSSTWNYE